MKQIVGLVYSSSTARHQDQPASSRAMATLAMVFVLRRSMNLTQRWWSRRLPSLPHALAAGGQFPAVAHGLAHGVAGAVVAGGPDQESTKVGVAGPS